MMIRELEVNDSSYAPGEVLNHPDNHFTHITISYDISGNRQTIDNQIDMSVEKESHLIKVKYVNTTLYWQIDLDGSSKEEKVENARAILKKKLPQIFIGDNSLNGSTVTVFCMVGNLRGFAFKLS
ncbi:hypothetical protein [Vibrio aestuarianus]|uniref:hypothetical protein n=1 Tax=Vibrio aestuarianus TaxID=28171 RepID=UPI00237C7FDE|nr:hypothetical protein [Vibrio aestuarianus]MDE1334151.1 hypothetical protein [Vibrio aestuarianus]